MRANPLESNWGIFVHSGWFSSNSFTLIRIDKKYNLYPVLITLMKHRLLVSSCHFLSFLVFLSFFLSRRISTVKFQFRVESPFWLPADLSSVAWSWKYLQSHTNQSNHRQTGANRLEIPKQVDSEGNPLGLLNVGEHPLKCLVPQNENNVEKRCDGKKKWNGNY